MINPFDPAEDDERQELEHQTVAVPGYPEGTLDLSRDFAFEVAMTLMRSGYRVTRRLWQQQYLPWASSKYIRIGAPGSADQSKIYIWFPRVEIFIWADPDQEDLMATDWCVYED